MLPAFLNSFASMSLLERLKKVSSRLEAQQPKWCGLGSPVAGGKTLMSGRLANLLPSLLFDLTAIASEYGRL
jgi:hypothetical protein